MERLVEELLNVWMDENMGELINGKIDIFVRNKKVHYCMHILKNCLTA